MYLSESHYLRENEDQFRGQREHRVAPMRMTGVETKRCGMEREQYLREGGVRGGEGDPVRRHGVKRLSKLFTLPYWEVSAFTCSMVFCVNDYSGGITVLQ
ncbi:hypothetical protein M758_UG045000 [Ceratodon purpureus]|nr:hypothetical protein M758_UG045000 [Ceratodon purpureus]